jgi:hypothetical protein
MGLTIHYSGKFNPDASLAGMIEEVKDIAGIYNWPFHVYETEFDKKLLGKKTYNGSIYGICFTPPGSETVSLSFLSNGRMSNDVNLSFYGNSKNKMEQKYLYMLFTKTQFAGIEIHKLIVHILKHIEKKYLLDFKVSDEGEYWEGLDENKLAEKFRQYNFLLDCFTSALESFPVNKDENFEAYFIRLMEYVNKKFKKE